MVKKKKKRVPGNPEKEQFLRNLGVQYARELTQKATAYELQFKKVLDATRTSYIFQHPVVCRQNHLFIIDFYLPEYNLAIELDGAQHYTKEGQRADKKRTKLIAELGIITKRVRNYNVEVITNSVLLDYLKTKIKKC